MTTYIIHFEISIAQPNTISSLVLQSIHYAKKKTYNFFISLASLIGDKLQVCDKLTQSNYHKDEREFHFCSAFLSSRHEAQGIVQKPKIAKNVILNFWPQGQLGINVLQNMESLDWDAHCESSHYKFHVVFIPSPSCGTFHFSRRIGLVQ